MNIMKALMIGSFSLLSLFLYKLEDKALYYPSEQVIVLDNKYRCKIGGGEMFSKGIFILREDDCELAELIFRGDFE